MIPEDTERGHLIYEDAAGEWRYCDDDSLVHKQPKRPCALCGRNSTPEGHDACLGTLPGVWNACCGHGNLRQAYIQFEGGRTVVRGERALATANLLLGEYPWE